MRLFVILKDKIKNIVLTNENFIVLKDEPIPNLKERLFFHYNQYYPNFIKITDENNNVIDNESMLNDTLYITNIEDEFEKKLSTLNVRDTVYNDILILNDNVFKQKYHDVYEKFKLEYNDLLYDDFVQLILKFKKNIKKDISQELNYVKKYKEYESELKHFYTSCYLKDDVKQYYPNKLPKLTFKTIVVNYKLKDSKTIYLNLKDIFNNLPLSHNIPMIGISPNKDISSYDKTKKIPIIKVFNDINKDVNTKEFNSWLLNEQKKTNIKNYKKIKGMLLKVKRQDTKNPLYITININEFGNIEVKILFNKYEALSNKPLDDIITNIKNNVQYCINEINKLDIVQIDLENYTSHINSITCSCDLNTKVDNNNLEEIFNNSFIHDYIFEKRQTKGSTIIDWDDSDDESVAEQEDTEIEKTELSAYYKKYTYNTCVEDHCVVSFYRTRKLFNKIDDTVLIKKGININIKDNPYKIGSIITIYSANNLQEIYYIIDQIICIDKLSNAKRPLKQILKKEKDDIKDRLREAGIHATAKGCQSHRQITIDDKNEIEPLDDSYILNYKNLRLVCDKDEKYKFPGFTDNNNEVCCFENDQRQNKKYIRNMESDDYVYPSNFTINIKNTDGVEYTTFLIKNDYNEFFFLNKKNVLVPINDTNIIKKIEEILKRYDQDNKLVWWLDRITISQLISQNAKTCDFLPNLSNKLPNNINKQCENHSNHKYFGYTERGYPCCFDKKPLEYKNIPKITKKYTIIKNKLLIKGQIGVLLDSLHNSFNNKNIKTNIKDIPNGEFYRMGVTKNAYSFLNAVSFCLYDYENSTIIKNTIKKYLLENPKVFNTLNNGKLLQKYSINNIPLHQQEKFSLNNYIKNVENNRNTSFYDLIDIIRIIYNINIILIDIPVIYTKSSHDDDEKNIKIICNVNCQPVKENKYIVIFKKDEYYEILVYYNNDKLKYLFSYDDSDLFKILTEFYNTSCKKEIKIPNKIYKTSPDYIDTEIKNDYKDFIDGQVLINALNNTDYKITGQVLNKNKSVNMLISKDDILIPIKRDYEFKNLKIKTNSDLPLKDGNEYMSELKNINMFLKNNNNNEIKILGITKDNRGLLTNILGFVIPIKETQIASLEKTEYNYINVDDIDENEKAVAKNLQINYSSKYDFILNDIYKLKKQLSYIISQSDELINYMSTMRQNIIKLPRFKMINEYNAIFKKIINVMKTKHNIILNDDDLYLNIISNEIIDNNVEKMFLKGVIRKDSESDDLKKNNNETIIFNLSDLNNFTSKMT